MERRQLVTVLAWLKHERRRLNPRHDLLKRTLARRPIAVLFIHQDKVLLHERTLRAAQQRLVNDLALPEHILKPVRREAARQAPPDAHGVNHLSKRLEPRP